MKHLILLLSALCVGLLVHSQQLLNKQIGYQEPYTQISAQAVDSNGNRYYAGTFRAALTINNQVIMNGNGGDDAFIIKMNPAGGVVWARNYGDTSNQQCNHLILNRGSLYLSMTLSRSATIGGTPVSSYSNSPFSVICKLDTVSGSINWIRKTSLPNTTLFSSGSLLVASGALRSLTDELYLQNNLVLGSSNLFRQVFVYMDTAGSFAGHKVVSSSALQGNVRIATPYAGADGRLYFLLQPTTIANSFQIGSATVNVSAPGTYAILVKTDTSLTQPLFRLLNPSRETYVQNLFIDGSSGFTVSEKGDSLYMILAGGAAGASNFTLDGFNVATTNQHVLLVMDSGLISRRVLQLGTHAVDGTSFRVRLRQLLADKGQYYLLGTLAGNNNAPAVPGITVNQQAVSFLAGGPTETVDVNGVSYSFLLKVNNRLQGGRIRWLGSHEFYENTTLLPTGFTARNNRIYFLHQADNVWNPWMVDSSLAILSGTMQRNADGAETPTFVRYFGDGTRIVAGLSKGRTAIDPPTAAIPSVLQKNDLFFLRLSPTDQVMWFKRLQHSFGIFVVQKIVTHKGRTFVALQVAAPRNTTSSNYVKTDTDVTFVTPAANGATTTLLLMIDSLGRSRVLQLAPPFQSATAFDVFSNGDLLVTSPVSTAGLGTVPGKTFASGTTGYYVARVDTMGVFKDAVQVTNATAGTSLTAPVDVWAHPTSFTFTTVAVTSFPANVVTNPLEYRNGVTSAVSFQVNNPRPRPVTTPGYCWFIKGSFLNVMGTQVMGPGTPGGTTRTSAVYYGNRYFSLNKTGLRDSIFANNSLLVADTSQFVSVLVAMDSSLQLYRHRVLSAVNQPPARVVLNSIHADERNLFFSGAITTPLQLDTIQVNHAGLADAVTLQLDTLLRARRLFRLSSIYNDAMYFADVYRDSLISFAYASQGDAVFSNNRNSGVNNQSLADLDETAYVNAVLFRTSVITSVPGVTRNQLFKVFPNPVRSRQVQIDLGGSAAGPKQWRLYNGEGRLVEQGSLVWTPGQLQQLRFRKQLSTGHYVLVVRGTGSESMQVSRITVEGN